MPCHLHHGLRQGVRIGSVDREAKPMIRHQSPDQAEVLRQDRPPRSRGPKENAARADKALIGGKHDVTAFDHAVELATREPPVLDMQPELRPLCSQASTLREDGVANPGIDIPREDDRYTLRAITRQEPKSLEEHQDPLARG